MVRAVVPMVRVVVAGLVPLGVTEFGEAVQVDWAGALLHEIVTGALNPPSGVTVTVNAVDLPATTVPEAGVLLTEKSAPEPPSCTLCGLLGALSVNTSEPDAVPAKAGVKTTLTVQFAWGARLLGQVFVSVNAPVAAMLLMTRAAVPELVTVTVWAVLVVPRG
jgi:hypothetical protein